MSTSQVVTVEDEFSTTLQRAAGAAASYAQVQYVEKDSLDVSPGARADERASIDNGKPGGKLVFNVYVTGSTVPSSTITVPISK